MAIIFITGSSSGIGKSLAEYFLKQGHKVGGCGRRPLPHDDELLNYDHFSYYQADVQNYTSLENAVEQFIQKHKGLNIMIANAGISSGRKKRIPDFNLGRQLVETNISGVTNSIEISLKYFQSTSFGMKEKRIASINDKAYQQIVTISSVAGFIGLPGTGFYSATKAFVTSLMETLAIDLPPMGINITNIAPGFISTPLTDKNKHSMPFIISSERAAHIIAMAIRNKKKTLYFS